MRQLGSGWCAWPSNSMSRVNVTRTIGPHQSAGSLEKALSIVFARAAGRKQSYKGKQRLIRGVYPERSRRARNDTGENRRNRNQHSRFIDRYLEQTSRAAYGKISSTQGAASLYEPANVNGANPKDQPDQHDKADHVNQTFLFRRNPLAATHPLNCDEQ